MFSTEKKNNIEDWVESVEASKKTGVNIPLKAARVMRQRMQQDVEDSWSWSSPPLAPEGFWSPRSPEEGFIIKDSTGSPASSERLQSSREEALQARIRELEQSLRRVNQLHRSAAKRAARTEERRRCLAAKLDVVENELKKWRDAGVVL